MSLSEARALVPGDAVVESHEPARDAAALEALARWALRFTPMVQPDPPDGLLLEITGCEHLHGGARPMLRHVIEHTSRLGLEARGAIAPTIGGAWALARFGPAESIVESPDELAETMSPLPVRALRIDSQVETSLHAVAVETVGQLRRLPRRSLAERFGEGPLLRLDQALGEAFETIEPIRPSQPVQVERVFDGPVKQSEAILQTGRELIEALCRTLAAREAGARQLRLDLERIDTHDLSETLTLSRPSRDARHLRQLIRPKLEQVHMGHGIERIALRATSTARLRHHQQTEEHWQSDLHTHAVDRSIGELVDRLVGRFGSERVSVVQPQATYVPERRFMRVPLHPLDARPANSMSVVDADRPTALYHRPHPVSVMLLSPDGPVMTMSWPHLILRIRTTIGPERITPRWWLRGDDHRKPAPRDYFKVQDERGRWWWLYRRAGTSHWFVHGRWC